MLGRPRIPISVLVLLLFAGCSGYEHLEDGADVRAYRTWAVYGGDAGQTRYSSLDQINRSNVHELERAWVLDTDEQGPTIECNPIVVGRTMYLTSPLLDVLAVDAATGEERWRFEPFENYEGPRYWREVSRGVTYWTDGDEERILAGVGPFLYALDARTGVQIPSFGNAGRIDLREGLGRDPEEAEIIITSPGAVYEDLVIVGANVSESPGAAPGHIRAFDVRTGELAWTFHTIPQPGEFGNETWEDGSWQTAGGANAWAGFAIDEERGIVYAPTGAPTYDFYGGNRKGANLFGNSLIALDAATGKRIWHYQTVHHDIWDYDLPAPPNLLRVNGIDAVAQVTKTGFVFLFDRETGEPLFEIEERPVPASDVPGEEAWPTQPFPVKPPPFARQGISEDDLDGPDALELYRKHRSEGLFTPGSAEGTLMLPGFLGGANWGGSAVDPTTGILYVSASNFPSILTIKKASEDHPNHPAFVARGDPHFVGDDGLPAIKPPWGTLTAIDLNAGDILWQVPLGTYPQSNKPSTGTLNLGGAIVTAGGLVFIGSTMDRKFRAFDSATGEVLWETELPTGGMALPATYEVDGKQFVVVAAGGGVGMRGARPIETPPGDTYVAFSLP